MIVFKVMYDEGGREKSLGARFGPMAIEDAFYRYSWRGAEDGSLRPAIEWAKNAVSLGQYRKEAE